MRKLESFNSREKFDRIVRHLEENTKYGMNHPFFDSMNKELLSKLPATVL